MNLVHGLNVSGEKRGATISNLGKYNGIINTQYKRFLNQQFLFK